VTLTDNSTAPEPPNVSLRSLLTLAWPIVVSMLSVSTMTLTNMLFVSRLGPAAITAVGLGGSLLFSLWCFPMGLLRATKILVSRAHGAKDVAAFGPYTAAGMQIALGLGLLVTAIGWCVGPWLSLITETEESGRLAGAFLSTRALASIAFLGLIVIQEVRQGQGDSRTAMFTTLFSNLMNIVLTYVFVVRWDLGVSGAAWASNTALTLELLALGTIHARRSGIALLSGTKAHRRQIWRLGVPTGVQFGLEVTSLGILVLILASFSERHAAAHQIAMQVLHFCFLPAMALGEAGSVLVGQAFGAGHPELTYKISKRTLQVALGYAALCGVVLLAGRRWIVGAFTQDEGLTQLTLGLFWIVPIFQMVDAANVVVRALLRGAGDVKFVAVAGILTAWVCTPPMALIVGRYLGYGVYGAWAGLCAEVLIVTGVLLRRLWKLDTLGVRQ
jgi:MATE family multidrug resistance protein